MRNKKCPPGTLFIHTIIKELYMENLNYKNIDTEIYIGKKVDSNRKSFNKKSR